MLGYVTIRFLGMDRVRGVGDGKIMQILILVNTPYLAEMLLNSTLKQK